MANVIKVIGVGPGNPDYLTSAGAMALEQAEVLVGARRLLANFARPHQELYPLGSDIEQAVEFIRQCYPQKQMAVLVSGDTGLYSFAATLVGRLPEDMLEFIPGISSVQLMFARLKFPWQDAVVISRHGREDSRLTNVIQAGLVVAVLTDAKNNPQALAKELLAGGCKDLPVSVGCNLSLDNELLFRGTLVSLAECENKFLNCVVVIGV